MITDEKPPEFNAKPIKRLLRRLREVDKEWGNGGEAQDGEPS